MVYNFAHGEYASKPNVRYLHGAGDFPGCYQSRMKTNIKEFRLRKHMTQDTLAELVGMSNRDSCGPRTLFNHSEINLRT